MFENQRLDFDGSEAPVTSGEGRVEICRLLKEPRASAVIHAILAQMPQASLIGAPGVEVPRRLAYGALLFGIGDARGYGDRHRLGDFVLNREDVSDVSVVALGPDVLPVSASTNCAVTRMRLPDLRSLPSST